MDWLRVQLGFMRQRGLKVILIGHVPPARTDSKSNWDETCWQKYVLWLQQYRDIIVGALYGHMNIDHFMLQDFEEVSIADFNPILEYGQANGLSKEDSVSLQSAGDYLIDLRENWSRLPREPSTKLTESDEAGKDAGIIGYKGKDKKHKNKNERYLHKIGGKWAERFAVSQIGPSIIPNYFPTLRIFTYNISGVDDAFSLQNRQTPSSRQQQILAQNQQIPNARIFKMNGEYAEEDYRLVFNDSVRAKEYMRKNKKNKPSPAIPDPPPLDSSPGPAYSPQAFTLLGYTQYFVNLTSINKSASSKPEAQLDMRNDTLQTYGDTDDLGPTGGNGPDCKHIKSFNFEVEYDTRDDKVFKLKDLTVRNYLRLAERIGKSGSKTSYEDRDVSLSSEKGFTGYDELPDDKAMMELDIKMEKHRGKKKKNRKYFRNNAWLTFVKRAFIGTKDDDEIEQKYG